MKSILNLLSIREYIMGGISLLFAGVVHGQNPIVQTCYTTDPAPMVHDGTLYVYTGHDEDKADFFWMQEWRVYSTKDMVNWTDHGSPLAIESFDWADDRAWAAQCIEHNGKFYWYVCLRSKLTNTMAIGVAVGDSPLGPFKDAIGKPLYDGSWDFIDPTVFVDDDGQAYLYWGNPNIYYVKLNDDMISLKGEVRKMEQTIESFGAPNPDKRIKVKSTRIFIQRDLGFINVMESIICFMQLGEYPSILHIQWVALLGDLGNIWEKLCRCRIRVHLRTIVE